MSPEEKELLERSLKLAEENSQLLKKMEARAKRATVYSFIKWTFIVLPLIVGYFYLEPFINSMTGGQFTKDGGLKGLVGTYQDLLKN